MGRVRKPQKKKLIVGFIYKNEEILKKVEASLIRKFGPIDSRSPKLYFTHTKFYKKEMGKGLKRKFISFGRLIRVEEIWRIKLFTNGIEHRFSNNSRRTVNIDPGYISLSKLVLLTTKDYTHRLYLGGGIFGEVTLFFRGGSFHPWEHTYPDYKTIEYINFFNSIRAIYKGQLTL